MAASIYWHDYESWGADPRRDRASQFAGVRTDLSLEEIDQPLMLYCQPSPDRLPHPKACLITGITPDFAQKHGVPEAEFVRRIHEQFSKAQTCVAGYNNIRFDDELSRQLLYRNFYDPYEREWKNGNSRWDTIDTVRLCYAVRPEGVNWPRMDDGTPVFKLEALSKVNDLMHDEAHDALSDVRATIALARKVRTAQPRLFQYAFDLRSKHQVQAMVELQSQKPILHISSVYPAKNACMALIMPLAAHPQENNGIIVYDLSIDPSPWLGMTAEQLGQKLFVAQKNLAEGEGRLPVSVLHTNRCPVIAPISVLDSDRKAQSHINWSEARKHWDIMRASKQFTHELLSAISIKAQMFDSVSEAEQDPDEQLYSGGFFSDSDKRLMLKLRTMTASELANQHNQLESQFKDSRLAEMLFRYRARNFQSSLNADELNRWQQYCWKKCLNSNEVHESHALNLFSCRAAIQQERLQNTDSQSHNILDALEHWLKTLEQWGAPKTG
ncbi:MAG: exodeoxyribonuclease I [Pseudohongiella sp.]|nr:exodeoxyribonuclease I [Pseudohongiella sp.]